MPRTTIAQLEERVRVLEAEAEVRRIQARYMLLCDTPCPVYPPISDTERIDMIVDLYAEDAVWEGVGEYYTGQFGRAEGKAAIRAHFERFWDSAAEKKLVLNVHYLTSEQIMVKEDRAQGLWVHMQPWLYDDGTALLRSSRLNNSFARIDGQWRITRTRTENVLISELPDNFASAFPTQSELLK